MKIRLTPSNPNRTRASIRARVHFSRARPDEHRNLMPIMMVLNWSIIRGTKIKETKRSAERFCASWPFEITCDKLFFWAFCVILSARARRRSAARGGSWHHYYVLLIRLINTRKFPVCASVFRSPPPPWSRRDSCLRPRPSASTLLSWGLSTSGGAGEMCIAAPPSRPGTADSSRNAASAESKLLPRG